MSESDRPSTPVTCKLTDCCYWDKDERDRVVCRHMDKPLLLRVDPCPLYRIDWQQRKKHPRL